MLGVHLTGEKRLVHGVFTASATLLAGCAPTQPIIVNPTEPWEHELARERQAAEASQPPEATVGRQMYDTSNNDEAREEPQNSAVVVVLADIVAFPFRGAGWVVRQIF